MDKQPQEVNLDCLNLEKLIKFIDELREANYQIGISQYIAVQNLILALIAQGDNLDRPQRFKTLLGPLLCHSPTEQEDFYQRFDQWLTRMGFIVNPAPTKTAEELQQNLRKLKKQERKWWLFGTIIALITFVFLILILFQPIPIQLEPPISQTTIPTPQSQRTEWPLILVLIILLPVVTFLAWRFWWFLQAYKFLVRYPSNQQPQLERLFIPGFDDELFPKVLFLHIAQGFRRRIPILSQELNVKKTVEKTVCLGGFFSPVYDYRQLLPKYLVLIDRTNYNDHQARFVKEMTDRFSQDQVLITGYYFDSDPRVCFPMTDKGTPQTLREIAAKYSHYRLILFSDAEGLFSSHTGELESWNYLFTNWSDRAVLTPKPPEHWGYKEFELSRHFAVLPATPEGLMNLAHSIKYEEVPYTPSENSRAPFPEILRVRSRRWIERDPPESLLVDEVLKSLQGYLGTAGYRWLRACAIFPEMHWNLTLYLGNSLRLLQDCQITDLARLPWFRDGYMPDWLRIRLIEEIPPPEEQKIRRAIEALLVTAVQGHVGKDEIEIAKKNPIPSILAKSLFRLLAREAPEDSLLKDYIFQQFMAGKQKKLAFRIPKASQNAPSSKRTEWRFWLQWFLVTTFIQALGWSVGWLSESIIIITLLLAFSGVIAKVIQMYILIQYVPKYIAKRGSWILASSILTGSVSEIGLLFAVVVVFVKAGSLSGAGSVALVLTITGAVVFALGVALAGSSAVAFAAVVAAVFVTVFALAGEVNIALIIALAGATAIAGIIAFAIIGPIAIAIAQALKIAIGIAQALKIALDKAQALSGAGILAGVGILAGAGILSGDIIGILAGVIILAGVRIIQSLILDGIFNQTVPLYRVWTLSNLLCDAVSCLAIPVAYGVRNFMENYVSISVANIAFGATLGSVSGIVSGAITGAVLLWLLRQSPST